MTAERGTGSREKSPAKKEFLLGAGFLAAALALRSLYILHYTVNSDEPQHLHVAWLWAQGLVQYRDLYDNHTPLFHLAFSPLVALLGDRPDLLYLMRFAMLPVYLLTIWAAYLLGKALFDRRAGWWGALFAGFFQPFYAGSVEFRTDDLWALLWVAALAALAGGAVRPRRGAVFGLLVGAAFAVSLKTLALCMTGLSGLAAAHLLCGKPLRFAWRKTFPHVGAILFSALAVLCMLALFFMRLDALGDFYRATVLQPLANGSLVSSGPEWRFLLFWPSVGFVLALSWRWAKRTELSSPPRFARFSLLLGSLFYLILIYTAWPLITQQDFLPVFPVLCVLAAGFLSESLPEPFRAKALVLLVSAALLVIVAGMPLQDRTLGMAAKWKEVLALTSPEDRVLDRKGELIFRHRATKYVFETITSQRILRGDLTVDLAGDLIRSRTPLIDSDMRGYPDDAKKFIAKNYLPDGALFVAGRILAAPPDSAPLHFEIQVPAVYSFLSPTGEVAAGELDGTPLEGKRSLEAGWHTFLPVRPQEKTALVWAPAAQKGFNPLSEGPKKALNAALR